MQYINITQLSKKLGGRSTNSLYADVANGALPKPFKLGTRNLWIEEEVDAHILKQREEQQQ